MARITEVQYECSGHCHRLSYNKTKIINITLVLTKSESFPFSNFVLPYARFLQLNV